MSNDTPPPMTPKGSRDNPIIRKCRTVSNTNRSIHIGIPWNIVSMADIKPDTEFKIYIDFPDTNKIVLERINPT